MLLRPRAAFSLRRCAVGRLSLLAIAGLAGCAPVVQHVQPDPGTPPPMLSAALSASTQADAGLVHWRHFFKDARLLALIEAALAHNRDLRTAVARVEEARAQWTIARAERWPTLQFFTQARVDRTYAESLSGSPDRRLDFSLNAASFELDFFGRLARLSDAARANFLATEEARRATELALVAQVAELYLAQRQTDELLHRARATVESRDATLRIVTQAQQIGLVHELEVELAQAQLEMSRSQRAQLDHLRNQTDHLLRLLVGRMPDRLPPGLPLADLATAHTLTPELSTEILLLRPDVAAAEQRLFAARANVQAARAAFFPRVTLTGSIGVASGGLANLFRAGAWAFQPTLSMPILDGGRTQAAFDIAKAREVAVVAQYERTVQQAFREVADQLSARESLAIQVSAAARTLQAQRRRLEIHLQRHEAGLSGLLDVLDAERELIAAEQSHVVATRAQLDALVGLYKSLGGGAPPHSAGAAAALSAGPAASASSVSPAATGRERAHGS